MAAANPSFSSGAGGPVPARSKREELLDAAYAEFVDHGIRRVGVADIARRAGVARQTLYRQCGDKDAIIGAVVTRQVLQFSGELAEVLAQMPTPEARLVECVVLGIRAYRANPMWKALREYDPDLFIAQFLSAENDGRRKIRIALTAVVAGDALPFDDAERAVELVFRVVASLLISSTQLLPTENDEQVRELAETYLVGFLGK